MSNKPRWPIINKFRQGPPCPLSLPFFASSSPSPSPSPSTSSNTSSIHFPLTAFVSDSISRLDQLGASMRYHNSGSVTVDGFTSSRRPDSLHANNTFDITFRAKVLLLPSRSPSLRLSSLPLAHLLLALFPSLPLSPSPSQSIYFEAKAKNQNDDRKDRGERGEMERGEKVIIAFIRAAFLLEFIASGSDWQYKFGSLFRDPCSSCHHHQVPPPSPPSLLLLLLLFPLLLLLFLLLLLLLLLPVRCLSLYFI